MESGTNTKTVIRSRSAFVRSIWYFEFPKHAHFHVKGRLNCFGLFDHKRNENGKITCNNNYCVAAGSELRLLYPLALLLSCGLIFFFFFLFFFSSIN